MKALYYENRQEDVKCLLCPHGCVIPQGRKGLCGARENTDGELNAASYGKVTSISLDPVEKKPLYHFYPGSKILSVGSYGCNFKCPFCQNHEISMNEAATEFISPEHLAETAESLKDRGNIGLAYTYNEPFISFEFMLDCARLIRKKSMKNAIITNGFVNIEPLKEILAYTDAMNIDVKSFGQSFYTNIGGKLETVKDTVKNTVKTAAYACHVELTALIIPGCNDTDYEMSELSGWVASVNSDIPLHITRFFPRYNMTKGYTPTPAETIYRLCEIAKKNLKYVYAGNI